MDIRIEYCVKWNYLPKAVSLAETVKGELGFDSKLVEGGGGTFIVTADGKQLFSKKEIGRFPEHDEILDALKAL